MHHPQQREALEEPWETFAKGVGMDLIFSLLKR
jgi:hypothetical protein